MQSVTFWLHVEFFFNGIWNHYAVFPYIYLVLWQVLQVSYHFNKPNVSLTYYPEYVWKKIYLTTLTEILANGIKESTDMFPWHAYRTASYSFFSKLNSLAFPLNSHSPPHLRKKFWSTRPKAWKVPILKHVSNLSLYLSLIYQFPCEKTFNSLL